MTPSYNAGNFSMMARAEVEPPADTPRPERLEDDSPPSVLLAAAWLTPAEDEALLPEATVAQRDGAFVSLVDSGDGPLLPLDDLLTLPVAVLEALLAVVA